MQKLHLKKRRAIVSEVEVTDIDVVIVDAFSLLFRAFHAFPLSLTTPDGQLTNAVYGFTRLLLDMLKRVKPEYLVVATDMGKPTFRHQAYTQYKANREEAPHELTGQIHLMKDVLHALNIPTIGIEGYEADDVIGTLTTQLAAKHSDLLLGVMTGDRDSFQLIGGNVFVLIPDRQHHGELQLVDSEGVITRLGVRPNQIVDFKALCGDASDNIPGVRGIGPKTAASLLARFDTLERLYAALSLAADVEPGDVLRSLSESERKELRSKAESLAPATVKKLAEATDDAWTSQSLAAIDCQVPLDFALDQARLCDYNKTQAITLFDQLGFQSLKKLLPSDTFEKQVEEAVQASLF